jgi:hypothetical protein
MRENGKLEPILRECPKCKQKSMQLVRNWLGFFEWNCWNCGYFCNGWKK